MAENKRDFDEFLEKFKRHRELMKEELHKVIIGQDDPSLLSIKKILNVKSKVNPKNKMIIQNKKFKK